MVPTKPARIWLFIQSQLSPSPNALAFYGSEPDTIHAKIARQFAGVERVDPIIQSGLFRDNLGTANCTSFTLWPGQVDDFRSANMLPCGFDSGRKIYQHSHSETPIFVTEIQSIYPNPTRCIDLFGFLSFSNIERFSRIGISGRVNF